MTPDKRPGPGPRPGPRRVTRYVRLTSETAAEVDSVAVALDRSMSWVLSEAIEKGLPAVAAEHRR